MLTRIERFKFYGMMLLYFELFIAALTLFACGGETPELFWAAFREVFVIMNFFFIINGSVLKFLG